MDKYTLASAPAPAPAPAPTPSPAPAPQCLTVGVGGYLLGGGTNALGASAKYGFAVHNIIEMRIVLADGSIARVNDKKVRGKELDTYICLCQVDIWRVGGHREVLPLTKENDLWFALR